MNQQCVPSQQTETNRAASLCARLLSFVVRPTAPPVWLGVLVAAAFIAAETLLVARLERIAPQNAFGVLFLVGVLVVSASWGFRLAVATTLASAAVYVQFHMETNVGFVPAHPQDALAILIFLPVALLANLLAGQARLRAAEAEQRRLEADLAADLGRLMLRANELCPALDAAGERIAETFGLRFATLVPGAVAAQAGQTATELCDGDAVLGTLLIPADLPKPVEQRVHRLVPPLEAMLAAACHREVINAEISALAEQQAALRRVATQVARGVDPAQVYPAAVAELSRGLGVDHVVLLRYESGEALVLLAARDDSGLTKLSIGERFSLDGDNVPAKILATGAPARIDEFSGTTGVTAERIRRLGVRSAVGAPIIVGDRIWGALVIGSGQTEPMPPETEARISDFADLVATAISNAETRAELTASRARIVTAGDQARRRFERDLHDGAQQRIVSLGLTLRAVEAAIPAEDDKLRTQLSSVVDGLVGVSTELREISRGIHPAVLSKGGLGPAIKTLARRSAVPVALDLDVDRRMPESVEVAAYYVVAEALTNAAKHAQASEVTVRAVADDDELHLTISDDGIGGAAAGGGSGLIGLKDRVEALAGRLDIASPAGSGTTLTVVVPLGSE
jgi:signal transduction histidine kinase